MAPFDSDQEPAEKPKRTRKKRNPIKPRPESPRKKGKAKPWEPQPNEPLEYFRLFSFYRDMQRRSLAQLARVFGIGPKTAEKHCAKWRWVERAKAWDVELDRRVRDINTAKIAQMHERHINMGLGMQRGAALELQAWVHKIEQAHADAKAAGKPWHDPTLSTADILRLADYGIKIERLARGTHTEHVKTEESEEGTGLENLSIEELKQLRYLKQRMKGE